MYALPIKPEMVIAYEKESPQWLHGTIVARQSKKVLSVFTLLMTTNLDKVMVYGIGPPYTKSHDSLIT